MTTQQNTNEVQNEIYLVIFGGIICFARGIPLYVQGYVQIVTNLESNNTHKIDHTSALKNERNSTERTYFYRSNSCTILLIITDTWDHCAVEHLEHLYCACVL